MDIVIIGSGNVATALGKKALAAGHVIRQVVSRDRDHAQKLGNMLSSPWTDMHNIDRSAMLYIIALSDTALPELDQWLHLDRAIAVHTAGSVPMGLLKGVSQNYGVLYPLQSLNSVVEPIPDFPLLVDGNTPECTTVIQDFAATLVSRVEIVHDDQRKKLHLAAVVSGNFTNHLFALVFRFCKKEGLDFSLLLPMLKETVGRLGNEDPTQLQTGPAIRNDFETIQKHLSMLEQHPEMKKIYSLMSDSIMHYHASPNPE